MKPQQIEKAKFQTAAVFLVLTAFFFIFLSPQISASAVQPQNPVSGVVTVSGNEKWTQDIVFSGEGRLVVTGNLALENVTIAFSDTGNADQPAVSVGEGASFTLTNSKMNLANLGSREAVVSEKANVTVDHSEISGADNAIETALIRVSGGKFNLINGSSIRDNLNRGKVYDSYYNLNEYSGSILQAADCEMTIEDSFITNNQTGFVEPCDSYEGRCIRNAGAEILDVENSQINISKSTISKNNGTQNNIKINNSRLEWIDSTLSGQMLTIGYGSNMLLNKSDMMISGNSVFADNRCGAFSANDSIIKIEDGVEFINNNTDKFNSIYNPPVETYNTDLYIGKVLFKNNEGRTGAVEFLGGKIIIDGASFIENHGQFFPGALFVDACYNVIVNKTTPAELEIDNAKFIGNTSQVYKTGAVGLGGTSYGGSASYFNNYVAMCSIDKLWEIFKDNTDWEKNYCDQYQTFSEKEIRNLVQAEIHSAVFADNSLNTIISELDMIGGGAIYISPYAHLKMGSTAILNNSVGSPWSGVGAGIAAGPVSETYLYPRNGAGIFSNNSNDPSQALQDVAKLDENSIFIFSEKMFNGGYHNWQKDNAERILTWFYTQWTIRDFNNPLNLTGNVYGSSPTDKSIENASVIIQNNQIGTNQADQTEIDEYENEYKDIAFGYGAGIYNDGILEIGEPGTGFTITKVWDDEENAAGKRPTPQNFLSSLILSADGEAYDLGKIVPSPYSPDPDDPKLSVFDCEKDIFVTITVLEQQDDNTWLITFEGLPKFNDDGSEIIWTVDESLRYYSAEVSGDMTDGFSIVNTPKEEPESEPDRRELTFYRLLPQMDILPKTGFSALKPQVLGGMPKDLDYKPTKLTLEIPMLSVSTAIVQVPFSDKNYSVDWLGTSAGLLEGTAMPGKGLSVITGHNHLNTTEAGPFAFLQDLQIGDRIFITDPAGNMELFEVYTNEKISESDTAALLNIAEPFENSLLLVTCEDERPEGGYENRRVAAAKPWSAD